MIQIDQKAVIAAAAKILAEEAKEEVVKALRPRLATVREGMAMLRMGRTAFCNLGLREVKLGDKKLRFRIKDIEAHIEKNTEQ